MQDVLRHNGYTELAGPNPVLMQAIQDGYIQDAEGWRGMKKSRELTSHTYNSDTAEEIASNVINTCYRLLKQLEARLNEEQSGRPLNLFDK